VATLPRMNMPKGPARSVISTHPVVRPSGAVGRCGTP